MKVSFYNGVSGMIAYQEDMNRISHNVANSGTYGYKPTLSTFSDLLYTHMAVNSEEEPLVGHGVKIEDGRLIYQQGAIAPTDNALDFALMGDGFFAIQRPDGSIEYTRNGAFDISLEGDKGYLVTCDGAHVLDATGKPIELEREEGSVMFKTDGLTDRIGIYDFENPFGLQQTDGSCFLPTGNSGEARAIITGKEEAAGRPYQMKQYALERSAVNMATEMVNVIVTERAFQFNAQMVQTADSLEEIINNLRR